MKKTAAQRNVGQCSGSNVDGRNYEKKSYRDCSWSEIKQDGAGHLDIKKSCAD